MEIFIENILTDENRLKIKDYGIEAEYSKNNKIIAQGEYIEKLYLIEKGYVKLQMISEEGKVHLIGYCGEGTWFAEFLYFSGGNESNFTVEAATNVKCRIFNQEVKKNLINNMEVGNSIIRSLVRKNVLVEKKIEHLSFFDTEQRIKLVLKSMLDKFGIFEKDGIVLNFRITRKELAEISNASIERVDCFLKKAKEEGTITRRGHFFYIINYEKLYSQLGGQNNAK